MLCLFGHLPSLISDPYLQFCISQVFMKQMGKIGEHPCWELRALTQWVICSEMFFDCLASSLFSILMTPSHRQAKHAAIFLICERVFLWLYITSSFCLICRPLFTEEFKCWLFPLSPHPLLPFAFQSGFYVLWKTLVTRSNDQLITVLIHIDCHCRGWPHLPSFWNPLIWLHAADLPVASLGSPSQSWLHPPHPHDLLLQDWTIVLGMATP